MLQRKSDEAYATLRRRIMRGEPPPGAPLDEKALIGSLGVGRTPLREAIVRLEQEGLVTSLRRRGYVVTAIGAEELFRIFEFRCETEGLAAALAAERRTAADLAAFDALLDRIAAETADRGEDTAWNLEIDETFHALVAAAADNPWVAGTLSRLYGVSVRTLYLSRIPITFVHEELGAYRAVFDAIRARDAAAARRAMERHVAVSPAAAMMAPAAVRAAR